jgi:adenine-specific DNA glycosylase
MNFEEKLLEKIKIDMKTVDRKVLEELSAYIVERLWQHDDERVLFLDKLTLDIGALVEVKRHRKPKPQQLPLKESIEAKAPKKWGRPKKQPEPESQPDASDDEILRQPCQKKGW